jgi:hypothetical protein
MKLTRKEANRLRAYVKRIMQPVVGRALKGVSESPVGGQLVSLRARVGGVAWKQITGPLGHGFEARLIEQRARKRLDKLAKTKRA